MRPIKKKILTDANAQPIAVQIDYDDWMEIERILSSPDEASNDRTAFDDALEKTAGLWKRGDGLAYQIKIREEWDKR